MQATSQRIKNVQPIRRLDHIDKMKKSLLKYCSYRDYMMFSIGINIGLRIGDLLQLKVKDILEGTHIVIVEQKTDKIKRFLVNPQLRKEVRKYVRKMNLKNEQYLFPSRKGKGPITRVQAYRVLNKAAEMADIPDVGTHTLRKTFGYLHYQKFKDIALLQQILNHSNPKDTMIYIGLTQDLMDETLMDFYY
ncbi:site-specific integrase [Peribacillus sp. NJ4]|uniref:site-specific integrase n=1 Tax=Peribacillus sp. NJ4 TaxID=3055862 RepID=UPI00259FF50C|nr:site-specific integrase [Peribacillus sp. NJ4]MDM5212445.1 site-specific integrase [Peribacillus sp. NJ4]